MSKMRKPEMSVVRFEESDVICSSLYNVANTGDTTGYNLTITNPSGVTIFRNSNTGVEVDEMAPYGGNSTPFYWSENDNPYSLGDMIENDSHKTPTVMTGIDGDYIWSGGAFRKYVQ